MVRHLTQRAPDGWESARFLAVCVARSWFQQNGVVSSHPPAGNASRYAASYVKRVFANTQLQLCIRRKVRIR